MTKQNILNGVLAVAIVLVGFVAFTKSVNTETVVKEVQKLGSVVSSELSTNFFSFGELRQWAYHPKFNVATTTICAIKSPAATSTLDLSKTGARFDVSSTTASVVTIAKATTPYATTTIIGNQYAIAANAQAAIHASTTATQQVAATEVLAPNTWIVFGMQGGTGGTFSPSGQCSAGFTEL